MRDTLVRRRGRQVGEKGGIYRGHAGATQGAANMSTALECAVMAPRL